MMPSNYSYHRGCVSVKLFLNSVAAKTSVYEGIAFVCSPQRTVNWNDTVWFHHQLCITSHNFTHFTKTWGHLYCCTPQAVSPPYSLMFTCAQRILGWIHPLDSLLSRERRTCFSATFEETCSEVWHNLSSNTVFVNLLFQNSYRWHNLNLKTPPNNAI